MNAASQADLAAPARKMKWLGWVPLLALPVTAIWFGQHRPAWVFMWALSFSIFASLK